MERRSPKITKVFCGKVETVVMFNDGDKVIVKRCKGTRDDKATAIAFAFFRKCHGFSKSQASKFINGLVKESK